MLENLVARRPKRLLSKRAAARLLGVDRGTTLEELIRDGHLRLLLGKIPDTDIDRLLAAGIPEPSSPQQEPLSRFRPQPESLRRGREPLAIVGEDSGEGRCERVAL